MVVMHAAWSLRARGTFAYVSIVGLLGGITLLTNEIAVFLVIVPVIFALLERRPGTLLIRKSACGIRDRARVCPGLISFGRRSWTWAANILGPDQRLSAAHRIDTGAPDSICQGYLWWYSLMESVKQYSSSYTHAGVGVRCIDLVLLRGKKRGPRGFSAPGSLPATPSRPTSRRSAR